MLQTVIATRKEKFFARSIARFNLPTNTQNKMVEFVLREKYPQTSRQISQMSYHYGRLKELKRVANELTLQDYVESWDIWAKRDLYNAWKTGLSPELSCKLIRLGLTRLDWIKIPGSAGLIKALLELDKQALLLQRVEALGLSNRAQTAIWLKGVKFVYELVMKKPHGLWTLQHFGKKTLAEIERVLACLGLSLETEFDEQTLCALKAQTGRL